MLLPRYAAYGHDLNRSYIERARKTVPQGIFTHGPADRIPYPNRFFDAILLLDVLEHVPHEHEVVREIERVLRPGGRLVVSVPNKGALAAWDSLNAYSALSRPGSVPPTDDPSWSASPHHRHYSLEDLEVLFTDGFATQSVRYTGLGLAELVNLMLLLLFRRLPVAWAYETLQYLYFSAYMAEDLLPAGSWGYHMMTVFERTAWKK